MINSELNKLLVKNFPNLKNAYDEEVGWQEGDDTGSHTVYGDVLVPYLIESLEQNNETEVKKILIFIENILQLNDRYCEEVIAFSVLERIEYQYRDSAVLKNNIGDLTKKIINEIRNSNY